LFGRIADGRKILKDETNEPLSEVVELKRETEDFFKREVSLHPRRNTSPPENRPQEATMEVQLEAENSIANALVTIWISGSDLITVKDPSTRVEQAKEEAK
jgi:hypothetical protein